MFLAAGIRVQGEEGIKGGGGGVGKEGVVGGLVMYEGLACEREWRRWRRWGGRFVGVRWGR